MAVAVALSTFSRFPVVLAADSSAVPEQTLGVTSPSEIRRSLRTLPPVSQESERDATGPTSGLQLVRGGWSILPEITVRETYTDNVFLTPSGEKGDVVSELNPGIRVYGNERRMTFQLKYVLQNLFYASNSDENTYHHQLFSAASAELLRQLLFLDANATITQQNTTILGRGAFSNFGPAAFRGGVGDNINVTGDRQDVRTYTLSPYVVHQFGDIADAELRFAYDSVGLLDGEDVSNNGTASTSNASTSQRYFARVASGTRFNQLPWALTFDRRDVSSETTSPTTFEQLLTKLTYVYTPVISVLGDVGYEDNTFDTFSSNQPTGRGLIWDIGGRWTPDGRTKLEATYGHRFFGDRYFVDLTHTSRRTTWHISYNEDAQVVSQVQLEQAVLAQGTGIPTIDARTGLPIVLGGGIGTITDEVFVRRVLSGGVIIETLRNAFDFSVFDEEREFQRSNSNESVFGTTLTWTHGLTALTKLSADVGWARVDTTGRPDTTPAPTTGTKTTNDFVSLRLGIDHRLSRSVTTSVALRRIESLSTDPTLEFTENRIMGSIKVIF